MPGIIPAPGIIPCGPGPDPIIIGPGIICAGPCPAPSAPGGGTFGTGSGADGVWPGGGIAAPREASGNPSPPSSVSFNALFREATLNISSSFLRRFFD
jgi:hypothetical protein